MNESPQSDELDPRPPSEPDAPFPEPPKILQRVLADLQAEPAEEHTPAPSPPPKGLSLPKAVKPNGETTTRKDETEFHTAAAEVRETTVAGTPSSKPPPEIIEEPPPDVDEVTSSRAAVWGLLTLLILMAATALYLLHGMLTDTSDEALPLSSLPTRVTEQPAAHPTDQEPFAAPAAPVAVPETVADRTGAPVTPDQHPVPTAAEPLAIAKLVLCRDVTAFGHYDPIPNIPLTARHLSHMQAYVEIVNPKNEARDDGRHNYYLTKEIKLYRTDTGPSEPLMDTAVSLVYRGMSPRRDFYAAQPLRPTGRIEPGSHTLVVRITDQTSRETAMQRTTFVIHPD